MTTFVLCVFAAYGIFRAGKSLGKRLRKARELQEEAQKLKEEYARRTGSTTE